MRENRWTVALVVSVLFGIAIAILAVLDYPNLGTVAAIGGILVGLMWLIVVFIGSGLRAPD